MIYEATAAGGGTLVELVNYGTVNLDCKAASLTAPGIVRVEISVDGKIVDVVFAGAGGSHTWWTYGGNKLLPSEGLKPGAKLLITASGPCALRIDWD